MDLYYFDIPRHPSALLKADSHAPWYKKVKAENEDKNDALASIYATGNKHPDMPWDRCQMHILFYCKTKHRRDLDNYMARSKKFIDACVFAGLITDDSSDVIGKLTAEFVIGDEKPATRMILTRMAAELIWMD